MPGLGGGGGIPRPPQCGWYKRRLPILTPVPGGTGGVALGGGALPALVVRSSDARRISLQSRAVVVIGQRPGQPTTPPRPMPPLVARADWQRPGQAFRTPLIAAKINVAGGVLPPWVLRRDYQRGGLVYRAVPFLKEPPPPVAGSVLPPLVVRWDYRRAALIYLDRPLLAPPPAILDGRTWISFYSEARQLEWFSWQRKLTWSPDMATYLTKRSGETRQYAMDFSELPELTNGSLAGVSSVVSNVLTVGASNLTLSSPGLGSNGKTATVWISGGQAGASYQIAFTVTLAGGTVLEEFGYLLVEDE